MWNNIIVKCKTNVTDNEDNVSIDISIKRKYIYLIKANWNEII